MRSYGLIIFLTIGWLVGCRSTVSRLELTTLDLGDGQFSAYYINKDEPLPPSDAVADGAKPAFTWALLSEEFQLFPVNTLERYLGYEGLTPIRLFQNNPLRSQQVKKAEGGYVLPDPVFQISSAQLSPSGKNIAFSCRVNPEAAWTVWIIGSNGVEPRLLAFGKDPVWRNDETIVYSSKIDGRWSVVQSSIEGGRRRVLVSERMDCLQPHLSPDGSKLAFVTRSSPDMQSQIWVSSSNGENRRKLTEYPGLDDSPVWGKDGGYVYFRSTRGGAWGAWKVAVD